MWIQTGVRVRKRRSWVLTSVTLTFDLWPWPFAWTSLLTMVITPENFMMIRWWEHGEKGVTDRQTDRRTENTICRAAWSQLKNWRSYGHFCVWEHLNMNIEDNVLKSHSCVIANFINIKKVFSGIIGDDLFISDVKMNLYEIFRNFQNSRQFEVRANFLSRSCTGSRA